MQRNRAWISIILLIMTAGIGAEAQLRRPTPAAEALRIQQFYFDAITYASDSGAGAHIDLYVQIPYPQVRFIRDGDEFVARFEIGITYRLEPNGDPREVSWVESIRVPEFSLTTSTKHYRLLQRGIDVEPGNYRIDVGFQDLELQRKSSMTRLLPVVDFARDSVSLSDIMIVSRLSSDGARLNIVPNISANVAGHSEGFFFYFEVYNRSSLKSVKLVSRILNSNQEIVHVSEQEELLKGRKTQSFVRVGDFNPSPGEYRVIIEAHPVDSTLGAMMSATSRSFSMRPSDLPVSIDDIDKAAEQLIYIARDSELRHVREAKDPAEKKNRFLEFWSKRDPDPQTQRNELMEEYYSRVEYANKHYGHYIEGWRTDMGMVYIRFGPPENVERQPFSSSSRPYEIWHYYQLNREFIFVDETGFGDYRLRYPTTDMWGRIR